MVKKTYIPHRGDIVWINLNPTKGHEQGGSRPALVISSQSYNERAGMMLACPITSQVKGYPFEVAINTQNIEGVVLVDHIRSIDWTCRQVSLVERCDEEAAEDVRHKLNVLINE
ncbi:MAG: endoribonuclease MazF [Candidatus Uhrbacteria bacterium]|nr:endoribonuclease MazF [Candidatus Uhrbacteria bacterium]